MKKLFAVMVILALSLATLGSVYADGMVLKSVDAVVSEIRIEQGIKATEQINPDKVSQAMLGELGDSVMEAMIGNTAIHDQMDINRGGDGSASLTAMHIKIGYHYLTNLQKGISGLNNGQGWGNMMGNYAWGNMMGNQNWNGNTTAPCYNNNKGTPNPTNQKPVSGWNNMMNSNNRNNNWNGMMN